MPAVGDLRQIARVVSDRVADARDVDIPFRLLDRERGVVGDVKNILVLELVAQAKLSVVGDGEAKADVAAGVGFLRRRRRR